MPKKVAYCTGFWSTNIGNAFFSLGVEYVLKQILGEKNITVVSDYQTYTTGYGKRLYPDRNQLNYISKLDVDYVVLAGPVLSRYFLILWKDILIDLEKRGVRYMILSAGMMKMTENALKESQAFFEQHPPFILSSRDHRTYETFGKYAEHAYDGICFSFYAPDYYHPAPMTKAFITMNFDKIQEPKVWIDENSGSGFEFDGHFWHVKHEGLLTRTAMKTDRFSDALIYAASIFPQKKREDRIGEYAVFRTDHRFHPHYREEIYSQANSFCADLPYGYLELYANSALTLSDRVHACAVTMAYGHPAMLFSKTNRVGLLERIGAGEITDRPVTLDMRWLEGEKQKQLDWLKTGLR